MARKISACQLSLLLVAFPPRPRPNSDAAVEKSCYSFLPVSRFSFCCSVTELSL
ncbi:hypothetical protein OIU78_008883, partial [Salix suchowensis]